MSGGGKSAQRGLGVGALVALLAGGSLVAATQPPAAASYHRFQTVSDFHALPPPEQTVVLSLGYRAALADVVYANALVASGLHLQEGRRFEQVGDYLDTVVALDPRFREVYVFGDALMTLQAEAVRKEDFERARHLLERGLEAFPHDGELWLGVGEFIAYVAPATISFREQTTPEERHAWEVAGAKIIARACELIGTEGDLPHHCLSAAGVLSKRGERRAMMKHLERMLQMHDDPEIRRMALGYLKHHLGDEQEVEAQRRYERMQRARREDLPFLGLTSYLVVGPPLERARCVGRVSPTGDDGCAATWMGWAAAQPAGD